MSVILAHDPDRRTNAQLIRDCQTLGYISSDLRFTLDPTYGRGGMWKDAPHNRLVKSDLHPRDERVMELDFTRMPFPDNWFSSVVFDPPYKLNGTSMDPSGMDERYGVAQRSTWQDRHALIRMGINECLRVLAPKGFLIVKCQDQVCAGRVRWQTLEFTAHAEERGARLVDALHVASYRPQPAGRSQVHARRNYSTALVLQKR